MKNKKRTLLRTLAGTTAGVGFMLAVFAAGTEDFRNELISMDEENRALYERDCQRQGYHKYGDNVGGIDGCRGCWFYVGWEKAVKCLKNAPMWGV